MISELLVSYLRQSQMLEIHFLVAKLSCISRMIWVN